MEWMRSGGSSGGVPAAAKDMKFVPTSAPESGKHGDDLLFAAHDFWQKDVIVFGLHVESLLDNVVAAGIQQM